MDRSWVVLRGQEGQKGSGPGSQCGHGKRQVTFKYRCSETNPFTDHSLYAVHVTYRCSCVPIRFLTLYSVYYRRLRGRDRQRHRQGRTDRVAISRDSFLIPNVCALCEQHQVLVSRAYLMSGKATTCAPGYGLLANQGPGITHEIVGCGAV